LDKKGYSDNFGKIIAKYLDSDEGRKAVANKIVQYISNEVEVSDLSGLILDKVYVRLGDQYEWIHRSKMKAYWSEPGSYAPRTSMSQRTFRIPTKLVAAHPEYEVGLLKAGRYGTVQEQIMAARDAILGEINAMVFNTLIGAYSAANTNFATCTVTGAGTAAAAVATLKAAIDRGIRWVKDRPGGAKSIVCRGTTADFMLDFANANNNVFSPNMVDEMMRKGIMQSYRGVPIVPLPQYTDAFGKNTIPPNYIAIVGNNIGKVVVEEEFESLQGIDVDTRMWHMNIWNRVGAGVIFTENAYLIKIA